MSTTQTTTATSGPFTLNVRDLLKGLLTAGISAVLTAVYEIINTGGNFSTINWKLIGGVAVLAMVSYLIKNFTSPAQIIIQNPQPQAIAAVKRGTAQAEVVHTGTGTPTPLDLNKPETNSKPNGN